jgi:DNA-binding response OmpR family regulator
MTTVLFLEPRDESRSAHASAMAGFDVTTVHDPEAALNSLDKRLPDIIIVRLDPRTRDLHLALCRQIRNDARTKQIPVLLTTDGMADHDVGLATDPGALVLTAPPDDGAKLLAALQGILAATQGILAATPPTPLRASLRRRRGERSA